jgi:CheY-like chemotaxis protein
VSRILIIEDEAILQEVYELALTAHGYEVDVAGNGREGLDSISRCKPSLILLDIFMPVMDGQEFLRNFPRREYPGTRIIVYTNLSDTKMRNEMVALGADEVILKASMTPDDLVQLVGKVLSR